MTSTQRAAPVWRRIAETVTDAAVVAPVRRLPVLQKLVRYVAQAVPVVSGTAYVERATYARMRALFLDPGAVSAAERARRARIVAAFERIHASVGAAHPPTDSLFVAHALLALNCAGTIVECGCYLGASTAKLSVLARETGRRLLAFDSFEGLPDTPEAPVRDLDVREGSSPRWTKGRYRGGLDVVSENVRRWGAIDVTTFHKGWFKDTLTSAILREPVALALTDVDLGESVRDCLIGLWPRLSDGGVFFSHDVAFLNALLALTDDELWRTRLAHRVPIVFGAGYGVCDASPHLGFLVKGWPLTPDYLARITLPRRPADGGPESASVA
ncbi:MAG TPA: TylF/MycF/NovP-related O-methyltransferase [Candidatus Tectomicrobia bacterium]|nr:TylF/MycF/NovP-related O-methyltransferase [Candidatus Tectomicrobia bacterium]